MDTRKSSIQLSRALLFRTMRPSTRAMEDEANEPLLDSDATRGVEPKAWCWLVVWAVSAMVCATLICLGFAYGVVHRFDCDQRYCDWVPNLRKSECNAEFCRLYWNVVIDGVVRPWLWQNDKRPYESNSTASPPLGNNTLCFRPVGCDEPDWWMGPDCQPVFYCPEYIENPHRRTLLVILAVMATIGVMVALAGWITRYALGSGPRS